MYLSFQDPHQKELARNLESPRQGPEPEFEGSKFEGLEFEGSILEGLSRPEPDPAETGMAHPMKQKFSAQIGLASERKPPWELL